MNDSETGLRRISSAADLSARLDPARAVLGELRRVRDSDDPADRERAAELRRQLADLGIAGG